MSLDRRLLIAASVLILAIIWWRPLPPALSGADAACYARISAEIVARPLAAWPEITWGGEPFYEHPPAALWVESVWFRLVGISARSALTLARLWASLIVLAVVLVARRLAGERVAAWSLVSLATCGGFLSESQNPMFELPLTAVMAFAIVGIVHERAWLFALAFVAAFFIKGPPALALLAPLVGFAVVQKRWRFATVALVLGAAALTLAIVSFEHARSTRGLAPFFATYFDHQVKASFVHGRHNPNSDPLYYLKVMGTQYTAFLVAIPVCIWLRRRDRLFQLGALWALAIVGGFSLAKQKYPWYVHPAMIGAAWVMGVGLEALVVRYAERFVVFVPRVLLGAAAVWFLFSLTVTLPGSTLSAPSAVIDQTPWPDATLPRVVSDCSRLGEWRAKHLFALYWHAERRACDDASAPLAFDGSVLTKR